MTHVLKMYIAYGSNFQKKSFMFSETCDTCRKHDICALNFVHIHSHVKHMTLSAIVTNYHVCHMFAFRTDEYILKTHMTLLVWK